MEYMGRRVREWSTWGGGCGSGVHGEEGEGVEYVGRRVREWSTWGGG